MTAFVVRRPAALLGPLLASAVLAATGAPARAQITYNVTFDDPGGANSGFYAAITSHTLAAGADWANRLNGTASLEVVVRFTTAIPFSSGRSVTSSLVRNNGTYDVYEQGAGAEIRTGADPNGATPDIELRFNPNYLANELFFDPDPVARTAAVPSNRTDAMSVFLHEIGHAIAFNGFRDSAGSLPGNFESTWDEKTAVNGAHLSFTGDRASTLYGGPVPITDGNNFHLGNAAPGAGSDLIPDLMNGVSFLRGTRYSISDLDAAVLYDTGLPMAVPEPAAAGVVAAAGLFWLGCRRRRAVTARE